MEKVRVVKLAGKRIVLIGTTADEIAARIELAQAAAR